MSSKSSLEPAVGLINRSSYIYIFTFDSVSNTLLTVVSYSLFLLTTYVAVVF